MEKVHIDILLQDDFVSFCKTPEQVAELQLTLQYRVPIMEQSKFLLLMLCPLPL